MDCSAVAPVPTEGELDARARERVCALCRDMNEKGWASGTGGGFSLREGARIYIAPSGVPKEAIAPSEIFVTDRQGVVLDAGTPSRTAVSPLACPNTHLKISACTPLFLQAYLLRDAGAVLHSHSHNACLVSLLYSRVLRIRGLEMIKGVTGGHVDEVHEVPIIDNTPHEHDLADSLRQAIVDFPKTCAVLVRGHGVYIWGRDWVATRMQAECYEYLFGMAVELHRLGIDPGTLDRRDHRVPSTTRGAQ